MSSQAYLLADQPSELERLQLQSRVWEPSGRRLLDEIGEGLGDRVLDVGCGAIGWLRLLSEWVGPDGEVVGTDIDDAMLAAARQFVDSEGLGNVVLMKDDLFASKLESSSFDLVHARFQIAPLGRGSDQIANHVRLLRPGGTVALEEWDVSSWNFNPPVRALDSLVSSSGSRLHSLAETCTSVSSCLTCSAASVSKGTSDPRSWRFLRDIPTCGCPSSLPPPWKSGCSP